MIVSSLRRTSVPIVILPVFLLGRPGERGW